MNEALLTEIITRLLSSPELQSLLQTNPAKQDNRPGCLILVNSQADIGRLPALTARYSPEYTVGVCALNQTEFIDSRSSRVSFEQAMEQPNWGRIHIPECSGEQLAQVALGLGTDKTCKLVAWAITQGIPVEIGWINWGFTAKTPDSYRHLFANYARQVASFGVVIDGNFELQQTVPVIEPIFEQQTRSEMCYEKRLLTGKEALQLPPSGIVRIAKMTVLAPGAIDVLKKQKIEVYREGVRCV